MPHVQLVVPVVAQPEAVALLVHVFAIHLSLAYSVMDVFQITMAQIVLPVIASPPMAYAIKPRVHARASTPLNSVLQDVEHVCWMGTMDLPVLRYPRRFNFCPIPAPTAAVLPW